MKRYIMVLLCICCLVLASCSNSDEDGEKDGFVIYYLDRDKTTLESREYEHSDFESDKLIEECFKELKVTPHRGAAAVPEDVKLVSFKIAEKQLQCYFNDAYSNMDTTTEVLCRAAIVKTFLQVPGVEGISFYVNDQPLLNSSDKAVGIMNGESFLENEDGERKTYQTTEVILYFADAKGDKLIPVVRELTYNTNVSLEKLVVEQLLSGPSSEDDSGAEACPTIPTDTKIISVSVKNGTCYVNLSEGFLQQGLEVKEDVVVYSIVNSLVELNSVNNVQISINGDSNLKYRNKINLSTPLIRNLDIVESKSEE